MEAARTDPFPELSEELLERGYRLRFRPGGHSMYPTIRNGEAVTVIPVNASEVKRGDIILYKTGRGLIAHRLVSVETRGGAKLYRTRGDAALSDDCPVRAEQILGKIVAVERGGRILSTSKTLFKTLVAARIFAARLKRRINFLFIPS